MNDPCRLFQLILPALVMGVFNVNGDSLEGAQASKEASTRETRPAATYDGLVNHFELCDVTIQTVQQLKPDPWGNPCVLVTLALHNRTDDAIAVALDHTPQVSIADNEGNDYTERKDDAKFTGISPDSPIRIAPRMSSSCTVVATARSQQPAGTHFTINVQLWVGKVSDDSSGMFANNVNFVDVPAKLIRVTRNQGLTPVITPAPRVDGLIPKL